MLRIMLNKLSNVLCHGELYGTDRLFGLANESTIGISTNELFKMRNQNEKAFWEKIEFTAEQLTGIKILYYQLFTTSGINFLNLIRENPQIKIIHLWRRDLEARHYSEIIFRHKRTVNTAGNETVAIKHDCSAIQIFAEAQRLINFGKTVNDIYRYNPIINIIYEDFISKIDVRNQLLDFLNIPREIWPAFNIPKERISYDNANVQVILNGKEEQSKRFHDMMNQLPDIDFLD